MKHNQSGITGLRLLFITVALIIAASLGWHLHQNKSQSATQSAVKKSQPLTTIAKSPQNVAATAPTPATGVGASDFYSCWNKMGKLNSQKPFVCTADGKTYLMPTSFDKAQIANFDKVPPGAQSTVIAAAKSAFDTCYAGPNPVNQTVVRVAQSNFVEISLGCDSGHRERFGLTAQGWKDLGGGQFSIDCETVDTYGITQAAFIEGMNSSNNTCYYKSGASKEIPK